MTVEGATDPVHTPAQRIPFAGVVSRLAAANFSLMAASLLTAPLQARALGAEGRGELAAVLVPAVLLPTVLSFGLETYATWAAAKGRDLGSVLATVGSLLLVVGGTVAAVSIPLAHLLAGEPGTVASLLAIIFLLAPLSLLGLLVLALANGLEEWTWVVRGKVFSTLITAIPIVLLFVIGGLTVTTAAIASMAGVLSFVFPLVPVFRRRPKLRWRRAIAVEGVRFGAPAWLGSVSYLTNARLDQLLMIRLVPDAQLGLYAVAVTLSSFFLAPVLGAVVTGSSPRITKGEHLLVARNSRLAIAGIAAVVLPTAIATPFVLRYVFGPDFEAATPVTLVLLAACFPLALSEILSVAILSAGRPGVSARAEGIGVLTTVLGLILLLGPLGIIGAGLVTVASSTATAGYLLRQAKSSFGGRASDYLVPRRAELVELAARLQRFVAKRRRRSLAAHRK